MAELIPYQGDGGPAGQPLLEGEVLTPDRTADVVLQPHPFSHHHVRFNVLEGDSLYAIVTGAGLRQSFLKHVRVWIGDEEIPRDVWHLVRPKAGTYIYIKVTPAGGGMGGNNMLRMMLMLAVVVAATAVAGPLGGMAAGALGLAATGIAASVATALIATGISMLGMYLVNMLVPPPTNTSKASERAFLDALRNRFNPFGPVPRILGKRRVYPVLAAHPYTETSNGKRYLRAVLLVGFGPLRISDIRIGETPINSYTNIELEIREGWWDESFGKFKLTGERWEFLYDIAGWSVLNATTANYLQSLRVTPTTNDPMLIKTGLAVNGYSSYIVRAKIRRVMGTSWEGALYYSTAGHSWSGLYYKSIPNPFTRNIEWVICEWDMSALTAGGADWRGNTITGLRFDLSGDANTVYEIAWIEVGYPCGRDAARTIYTNSISQLDVGVKLNSGEVSIRTTEPDSIGFGLDVQFPEGLAKVDFDNAGDLDTAEVTIDVSYRRLGTANWIPANWSYHSDLDGTATDGQLYYMAKDRVEMVIGGQCYFPSKGQYEVRVVRTTSDFPGGKKFGSTYWQSLRSIKDTSSINDAVTGGLALIEMRAKATDQFQSFPDQVNCIAESYLPVLNNAGGFTYDVTRNPAWEFLDLLRHRGREALITTDRINLTALKDWASACDYPAPNSYKNYWQVDAQIEDGSIFENCRQIAAHARASFIVENGLYSVVRDVPQTVPVQLITPKNSWGYNGMKQFIDQPHALRINFTNGEKNWRQDERVVYDDGYSAANATRFETFDYPYCTDPDQVFREARYQMAVGQLRPEQHRVTMDIENLRCTMGDYVMLSHDVLSIGSGAGRVTARVGTTTITGFTLDEAITMEAGQPYGVRYRRGNTGTIYTAQLANVSVSDRYTSFTFSAGIAAASAPLVGDLLLVGEFGVESAPMLVKRIEPGPDMTATLTLVDAQPGVWTADTRAIPPFNSYISDEVAIPQKKPDAPTFRLVSDEQALIRQSDGSLPDQIMIIITPPKASKVAATGFEMQWRRSPGSGFVDWSATVQTANGNNTLYIPRVKAGSPYDVRVRSVSQYGVTSDWVAILNHIVVGKTTPPAQVKGLAAVAGIDGVQLTWAPNTELDLKGYIVKQGTAWDKAVLVSEVLAGTTVFVKCDTSVPQTFLVRAIDVVGNLSQSDTLVTSASIVPEPVKGLEGYLQVDVVFLKWTPVNMVGVRYEVRQGADWKTARLISTVSNAEIRTRLPTISTVDRVFWVDAVSSMGIYSGRPHSVTLTVLAIENQNVVASKDLSALSFPGIKNDVSAGGGVLTLDLDASGVQRSRGDYYYPLDLGVAFSARAWVDSDVIAVAGSGTTWSGATFTWASATNRTWLGSVSENRAGDVTPRIALDTGFDSSLVEGWRWNGSANGSKGSTAPSVNTGMSFATPARFENGALFNRLSKLRYAVSVPSSFTVAFDVRIRAGSNNFLLFKLTDTGIALSCVLNQTDNLIALYDHNGALLTVPYVAEADDVATVVVTQSATERALYVTSRRNEDFVSATKPIAALGAFSTLSFYE